MMYGFKQMVSVLATPLVFALIMTAAAAVCWMLGRRRSSRRLAVGAATIAYLASITPVADALLLPLESQYPPLNTEVTSPARHIVVLGSHYAPRDGVPVTGALGPDGLARIVEGVRLARSLPSAQLVVSGGAAPGHAPSALGYAKLASELGFESERIVVVDTPLDTKAEAAAVVALLGSAQFFLVTSASHMPRAMRLMSSSGARPLAAPTGHRADPSQPWNLRSFLPFAAALRNSEVALHEYVGLLALSMGLQ